MQSTTLSIGNPIEARCTKCRKNTDHIIVTLSEEKPERVQCQSCNREHKYRPPSVAKKTAVRQAVQRKDADRKEWELMCQNVDNSKARNYSMTESYKLKSLIQHPVFGLGLVQRDAGSQKIEVLFAEGKKVMRCK